MSHDNVDPYTIQGADPPHGFAVIDEQADPPDSRVDLEMHDNPSPSATPESGRSSAAANRSPISSSLVQIPRQPAAGSNGSSPGPQALDFITTQSLDGARISRRTRMLAAKAWRATVTWMYF